MNVLYLCCYQTVSEVVMFLRKSRRPDGRVYVSIVRSYKDGKVTRAKTYESIGYFDPSDPSFDDDMARLEKRAVELEAK